MTKKLWMPYNFQFASLFGQGTIKARRKHIFLEAIHDGCRKKKIGYEVKLITSENRKSAAEWRR